LKPFKQFKWYPIQSKAHFNYVFKNAIKIRRKLYYLYVSKRYTERPCRAVVTSRKVGNAVQRNRCRRQIKTFVRLFHTHISTEHDMIVIVHSSMVGYPSQPIYDDLKQQLEKEGLWDV
jgi:ribonuclease P protein component